MTAYEVLIRALEVCLDEDNDNCEGCPLKGNCISNYELQKMSLKLIKAQRAEIEALRGYLKDGFEKDYHKNIRPLMNGARYDGIKKFERRFKEEAHASEIRPLGGKSHTFYMIRDDKLDDIVKELVGDSDV